ncbi:GIY-YIG nuclease family protein [Shimia sp. MIT1388]|uniref:GIY-YIG nuclease family protein n=1 Tax=Shimia sp. MIT1388 TaxID=3096992 RepID=UPI00399A938B
MMARSLGMSHFVYIMASRPGGALYVGRTTDLLLRVQAHRAGLSTHTNKCNIKTLVWFEVHESFEPSLRRERAIKRWRRDWKVKLITDANPNWHDITALVPA